MLKRRFLMALCLFGAAPAFAADIQPKDGLWSIEAELVSQEGCAQDLLDHMAKGAMTPVEFSQPFSPLDRTGKAYVTTKLGPNEWEGFAIQKDENEEGRVSIEGHVHLWLRSETHIEEENSMYVIVTGNHGEAIGMAAGRCEAHWEINSRRVSE